MNDVFKALADPTRRAILEMLRKREMTAGEIAAQFSLAKPTLSGHLNVLLGADLVHREREGTTLIYHLKLSVLEEAWLRLASSMKLGQVKSATSQQARNLSSCTTDPTVDPVPSSPSR
ncbi:autorepressor SdpR family transcription factor [Gluconobacter aidae]|uniref:Autorepressor SdpR family transcription factor n=1 Tax=Gluconobacter aidae TaxID=2662454 RepID=A0A7X1SRE1_9PROT|nr:autorepressor SdpR family transcription factor [Gluconobacter aidae]MQR99533.1 autorepressor SdpR family transcription factor [Gluconobacter aidae]